MSDQRQRGVAPARTPQRSGERVLRLLVGVGTVVGVTASYAAFAVALVLVVARLT